MNIRTLLRKLLGKLGGQWGWIVGKQLWGGGSKIFGENRGWEFAPKTEGSHEGL
jgi:hypothetical protein